MVEARPKRCFCRYCARRKSRTEQRTTRRGLPKLSRNPGNDFHLQRSALQRILRRHGDELSGLALLRLERRQSELLMSQRNDLLTGCADMRLVINLLHLIHVSPLIIQLLERWFNVKCSNTPQLYVLNERLYKYILPFTPKFPEDYSGPLVDK